MLRGFSLGNAGVVVGAILTIVGLGAYFMDNATLNLAGFFYGIPLLLGGLALKSAELKPVPVVPPTEAAVVDLRQRQATTIQKQIFNEVTRYRYGEEAHLQMALERLGLSPSDAERPILKSVGEERREDAYTLVLRFESPRVDFATWQGKADKMSRFFGPHIRAEVTQGAEAGVEVALIHLPEQGAIVS